MYDLARFSLTDMIRCGSSLRKLGAGAATMEQAADRVVRHLHDNLGHGARGDKVCVLVRFFKTHRYDQLDEGLRAFSVAHKAIPLPSPRAVRGIPMISQLIKQLGLEVSAVISG